MGRSGCGGRVPYPLGLSSLVCKMRSLFPPGQLLGERRWPHSPGHLFSCPPWGLGPALLFPCLEPLRVVPSPPSGLSFSATSSGKPSLTTQESLGPQEGTRHTTPSRKLETTQGLVDGRLDGGACVHREMHGVTTAGSVPTPGTVPGTQQPQGTVCLVNEEPLCPGEARRLAAGRSRAGSDSTRGRGWV
ncbi:hypothetical protein J1605_006436 [Eschrichtius robustus]|uniref:Uncharacterized protein n=1 Tax=Eschrichtius robustus TaxID=9764 RepID=A0AB34H568_ESCRO|nr:hypothetical protein J1605_006436 [Eschrichtius robustus]